MYLWIRLSTFIIVNLVHLVWLLQPNTHRTPNFIITLVFAPVSNMFYDIFSPCCYGFPSTIDFEAMKLDFPPIFNRLLWIQSCANTNNCHDGLCVCVLMVCNLSAYFLSRSKCQAFNRMGWSKMLHYLICTRSAQPPCRKWNVNKSTCGFVIFSLLCMCFGLLLNLNSIQID